MGVRGRQVAPRGWPTTAQHLSARLSEVAPGLAEMGIQIEWERRGAKSIRVITIRPTASDEGPPTSSGSSVGLDPKPLQEGTTDDADDADDDYADSSEARHGDHETEVGLSVIRADGESMDDLLRRIADGAPILGEEE